MSFYTSQVLWDEEQQNQQDYFDKIDREDPIQNEIWNEEKRFLKGEKSFNVSALKITKRFADAEHCPLQNRQKQLNLARWILKILKST